MAARKELKIFHKTSIEYLERIYSYSLSYVFDKNNWKSLRTENYWNLRIFGVLEKQSKRVGNELRIFKIPSIAGLNIIYSKCIAFVFDKYYLEPQIDSVAEENYLLRDLSSSAGYSNEKELRIFKFPNIEKLEKLCFKKNV